MDAREEMLAAVIEVAGWKWDDRPGIGGLSTWEAFIAHEVHAAGWRKMPDREALQNALDEATSSFGTGFWATAERDNLADAILALMGGDHK